MKTEKFKVGDKVMILDYLKSKWFKGTIKKINGNNITVDKKTVNISEDNIDIQIIKEYKGLKPKKMFVLYEYETNYRGIFKTLKEVESYLREVFDMNRRNDFKKFCADYKIVEEYRYM